MSNTNENTNTNVDTNEDTNTYCEIYNYSNEKQQTKSQVVEKGAIVEKWINLKENGKQVYRDTILINFVSEQGKAIPNVISVDMLKKMLGEHEKLQVARDKQKQPLAYRKKFQFAEPMEQVSEDDVTTLTIGVKYEPIRQGFKSKLSFG